MNERELMKIKEEIDVAKFKVSELSGKEEYLLQELQDHWKCSSIGEAKVELQKLEKEINELNLKIEQGIIDIEEKYNAI